MVYSLKRRPRRKTRRARRNPTKVRMTRSTLGTFIGKVRKSRRRIRKSAKNYGWHRPRLHKGRSGWKRPRRSILMPHATRVNPRRRVRHHRRHVRRNPALPFAIDRVAMGGLKIAGGIAIGFLGMPVIVKFAPASLLKHRKFFGLIHVILGAVAASFMKKPLIKDMALVVAGTGVYDLIASNLPMLGLPTLPNSTPLLGGPVAGDEPGVIGMEADYAPALGASYQAMGASYGADDISYGDDNPYGDM